MSGLAPSVVLSPLLAATGATQPLTRLCPLYITASHHPSSALTKTSHLSPSVPLHFVTYSVDPLFNPLFYLFLLWIRFFSRCFALQPLFAFFLI